MINIAIAQLHRVDKRKCRTAEFERRKNKYCAQKSFKTLQQFKVRSHIAEHSSLSRRLKKEKAARILFTADFVALHTT